MKDLGYRFYHRVIVRDTRQTATFTVSIEDGTLETDWKDETETAYKYAAKDDGDYSELKGNKQGQAQ